MALFNKSQQQMVLDLLISENPGLAGATLNNVAFVGLPVAGSGGLTTARLRGKAGSGFTGVKSFTYNRIDIGRLFANVFIAPITQYNAVQTSDLVAQFNTLYGLNINPSEVNNSVWGSVATSQTARIAFAGNASYVYYGNTQTFTWQRGVRQIYDYYPNRTLTAVTTPEVMLKAFQLDFSDVVSTLQAHDPSVAFTTGSSTAQAIVAMLKTKLSLPLVLGATAVPGSDPYDLSGFTLAIKTPDLLENSNPRYRQVAVLTPPAVYGNQYAVIYLHFDRVTANELSALITHPDLNGFTAP